MIFDEAVFKARRRPYWKDPKRLTSAVLNAVPLVVKSVKEKDQDAIVQTQVMERVYFMFTVNCFVTPQMNKIMKSYNYSGISWLIEET